jgi:AcrR family transcriptional regulator
VATPARSRQSRARKGAGRPEGESNLRENILDAAELTFAELGYAGTTLRLVAHAADVTQALISYYFGTKHGLFEATFLRRGVPITEQRMANLEALKASGRRIRLRDLVQAFLSPVLALRSTPEGRSFLRLQARLHTEPPSVSYELRTRVRYPGSPRFQCNNWRYANRALAWGTLARSLISLGFLFTFESALCGVNA